MNTHRLHRGRDRIVNPPEKIDLLNTIELGEELGQDDLKQLADISQVVPVGKGDVIFREGERHQFVYRLVDGQVVLEMSTGGSIPKSLLTLGRGDLLAWSAMLGGGRVRATARALQPTRLLRFDARQLIELCQREPSCVGYRVMEHLARKLAGRLLATRLQLLDLFRSPEGTSS